MKIGTKLLNLILNMFVFTTFGITAIAAFIISKTGLPTELLPIAILVMLIFLSIVIGANILKLKMGYRPLGKAGPKSTDKLFVALQAVGGAGLSILAIGYYKTGSIILVLSVIASWIVNREYVARKLADYI